MDGSPFQAATGKSGDLTKDASNALETAGFHRLGGVHMLMRMPAHETRIYMLNARMGSLEDRSSLKGPCDS